MSTPEISIIIPTRSRPTQLKSCLEAIVNLDTPPETFEVVIVDDGSPESMAPVVELLRQRLSIRLVVQPGNFGPAAARNAGAHAARGGFLVFIDDDCVPARGWLTSLMKELRSHPDCLLGGYVENRLPTNPYATASQHIATYARRYYEVERANEWFFGTNNFALSAERFRELGGFDTSIPSQTAEDKEFCDRWRGRKYQMAYVPDALVYHGHDLSWWPFVRQHFNYGRGILFFRLKRRRGGGRLIPERFAFYWNLILYPLRKSGGSRGLQQTALMVVSQVATVTGALWAALVEHPTRCRIIASPAKQSPAGPQTTT
jgi:glycosyltransferase involved in cell wall biosynthesis